VAKGSDHIRSQSIKSKFKSYLNNN